jgi:hypothetical protein
MAIQLHSFITSGKRYFQIESQPHHITGVYRKIVRMQDMRGYTFAGIDHAYFECEDDGTITFYKAQTPDGTEQGVWTYVVYECPEGEETVFPDAAINTSPKPLRELDAGLKLYKVATDIHEYLRYQNTEANYLDVELPTTWQRCTGRKIASILLEEYQAFKSSSLFKDGDGAEYMKVVMDGFIQIAEELLETGGIVEEFEQLQYDVLNNIKIDNIANLIVEYNDYRLWQAVLPSKSKAVEYAFNKALNVICRVK